ncbi:MAG: YihY/virulence factor BrkB family protein [Actinomycetota bacterium]|nr:YihY/virulence factor BrkB family protein [Actinomycetota bacterium]
MRPPSPQPADGKPPQPGLLERYRRRYHWFDHLVRAGEVYLAHNGDHYAGAIAFFSVLWLVPMLMITFAVMAFVLAGNEQLFAALRQQIEVAAPPGLGQTLNEVITQAIESRSGVGIFGLLLALYTGLAWMGYLREALTAQWEQPNDPGGIVRTKVVDLLALLGLGLALATSFGITAAGTWAADFLLRLVGLNDLRWMETLFYVLSLVLSLAGMWLVFLWIIARLPRARVTLWSAARAAVLGAVGFEVLKQVFALYLGIVTDSPAGRFFGPVIGLMVFALFASRLLVFVTAWAAAARENVQQVPSPSSSSSSSPPPLPPSPP